MTFLQKTCKAFLLVLLADSAFSATTNYIAQENLN